MKTLGRVLVTGASGFVGRRLCSRLAREGVRPQALLHRAASGPWTEHFVADLGREDLPAGVLEGIRTVFHLAGRVHSQTGGPSEDQEHFAVNLEGTRALLGAAAAAGVENFVFMSSVKAMGEGSDELADEEDPRPPETAYGRSKRMAEELVLHGGYVPRPCVLRPAVVYGAGSPGNLARMIRAVARGWFPPLPDTGNRRSMVHVDDLVEAAILAAGNPASAGRIYLVTDGHSYSTSQIYDWIRESLGRRPARWRVPRTVLAAVARAGDGLEALLGRRMPLDSRALRQLAGSAAYCSRRIREELGFRPARGLRESMPEMLPAGGGGRPC